jgi:hypothetical protein
MPIYEYFCPETKTHKDHKFELLVPMAEQGKPQQCPIHTVECQAIEFSGSSPFVWGKEDVHWSAGLGSNQHGMNQAKKL